VIRLPVLRTEPTSCLGHSAGIRRKGSKTTTKPPILPEPEVWLRKGTRRSFQHAVRREHEGATDAELRQLAAIAMGKVAGDIIRVLLKRTTASLVWILYAETLSRKFGSKAD
jgi:hypothetical protein